MVTDISSSGTHGAGMDTPRTIGEKAKAKALVIVEWQDIISDDGWVVAEDCELPTFYTVGWLEYQDDSVIKIATTLDFDDFTEEQKKKEKQINVKQNPAVQVKTTPITYKDNGKEKEFSRCRC